MLEVADVRKEFGGLVAVDGVDLRIGDEEIVGLIGPNGAGKTTLFDVVTGVHDPEPGGSVRFRGTDLTGLDTHDISRLGVVRTFQIVRVFGEMTAFENALAGASFGSGDSLPRAEATGRAEEALSFMGLAGRRDEPAANLTISEQKRLEVARALAADPDLVLLDEIASGLTPGEIAELSGTIRRIRDERGVSVFWIEHIMDAIMGTADRIVVLDGGRKLADGPPDEVRSDEAVSEAYLGDVS